MNHTTKITDCQDAIQFIPVHSLARSRRCIQFLTRVSTDAQDHDKYRAALEAAHNRLNLPIPFTLHCYTGNGQLDKEGGYFTWFAQIIQNMQDIVCVFPALDRLFRPKGFSQFDPATWNYQEADFDQYRQKLSDLGLNPDRVTFALLNDGSLESDRTFETRLGENFVRKQQGKKLDPKTIDRLKKEVRTLGEMGMTAADICFYLSVRLESFSERTIRGWYKDMGFSSKWDDIQHEARGLALVNGMNAGEIYRHFQSQGIESVTVRTIQNWLQGTGFSSKRGKPKPT